METRLDIPPVSMAEVRALCDELGVSFVVAQVLARRGLGDPAAARAFLAADERHDPSAFAGIDAAVALVLAHVREGSPIVVHGDYDVDGVCSTAILVGVLRALGARVDAYLPSRDEDGYGLAAATVDRLAARGTRLLVTADCAITAVEEVARARAAGMDVVVTDHHQPRRGAAGEAVGELPDAPIVHPALGGYPCAELCATAVAHKLAAALLQAAGRDPAEADEDLDLVALATVADCVPLRGENRRLVREGLEVLARTRRPGLRALMRVARVDPGALDARDIGFRLAPRINAAGRLHRADAGLELVLTEDADRAAAIAEELDAANAERRHVETRILFAAEAQVAELGEQPAYVLAGEDWHPGVIGIVASRIAERHHRPCVLIALDGEQGTGSGRSIPAFDLLAGLDAGAAHLLRHGGHRAAAGCTVARDAVEAFRAAFVAHAAATLAPEDLVPRRRVDAVVAGDELGHDLAAELERLGPFGVGNPDVALLVPAARLSDPRPMGEGKHLRFTVESGGHRARAVAFGTARLPEGEALDAIFGLELNEWGGAVEPRLVLRCAQPPAPAPITLVGEPDDDRAAALAELDAALEPAPGGPPGRPGRDRRGGGAAGVIVALQASGEPVLVVCADARRRRHHLTGRLAGVHLCSWLALERDPALLAPYAHAVALDPPAGGAQEALVDERFHLAWGEAEAAFAARALERDLDLRAAAAAVYRALRGGGGLDAALGAVASPAAAGRALRVLAELGLADPRAGRIVSSGRTDLERSPAFRACQARLAEGRARLAPAPAASPAAVDREVPAAA
jgi:single-stranded-DNA-specific exonuclease